MNYTIGRKRKYGIAVLAAVALLSGCQSNGMAPQTPSQLPQSVSQATSARQSQARVSQYSVTELATLGGDAGQGTGINSRGWVAGYAYTPADAASHAALWTNSGITDLGTLVGPNSVSLGQVNDRGLVAGISDTLTPDPYSEGWCGDGEPYTCLAFYWYAGAIHALPTLGGNNGFARANNSAGEIVGAAETATRDPNCTVAPQVFDYEAVRWDSRTGQATQLPNISGDITSFAIGINDSGDIVGTSGPCAGFGTPVSQAHAVLWPRHSSPINLPTLGGPDNGAGAINNNGDIVGIDGLPGDTAIHAVLWKKGYSHVIDLGTLPGYVSSVAFGINNNDQIIGWSVDANGNTEGTLWENGSIYDITSLLPPASNVDILDGWTINNAGAITGELYDPTTGAVPAFEATPNGHLVVPSLRKKVVLPERIRQHIMRNVFGPFSLAPVPH